MNSPNLQVVFGQHRYAVRFDWGPVGAQAAETDLAVVVDVLKFIGVSLRRGRAWDECRSPPAEGFRSRGLRP